MARCSAVVDRRFPVQQISESTWLRATAANAAADYLNGYEDAVRFFVEGRPGWEQFSAQLATASRDELRAYAERSKHDSVGFLVLMLTGTCNADCGICFTDRKKKPNELTHAERASLLASAKELGAQFVYVPGEGEPTIDHDWWPFLETCRELDLPAVVFTNGMIFGDDDLARRTWGMTPAEGAARLKDYPVHLYVKYWTPEASLAARLLGVPERRLPFGSYDGVPVPAGLQCLLETMPRERLGIEAVVERRTADDIAGVIAPFTERHGLARIIEMLQHNGRTFGDPSFDPTSEQVARCQELLSPTSCTLATCKVVVTVQGYLSPRIAVLEHQLPPERRRVVDGDLYDLLHTTDYIAERRYNLDCLCETIPLQLAGATSTITARADNVTAPALARTEAGVRAVEPPAGGCGGCGGGCACALRAAGTTPCAHDGGH
jgi:hypothetical protein